MGFINKPLLRRSFARGIQAKFKRSIRKHGKSPRFINCYTITTYVSNSWLLASTDKFLDNPHLLIYTIPSMREFGRVTGDSLRRHPPPPPELFLAFSSRKQSFKANKFKPKLIQSSHHKTNPPIFFNILSLFQNFMFEKTNCKKCGFTNNIAKSRKNFRKTNKILKKALFSIQGDQNGGIP
jgi:hypothetical protein